MSASSSQHLRPFRRQNTAPYVEEEHAQGPPHHRTGGQAPRPQDASVQSPRSSSAISQHSLHEDHLHDVHTSAPEIGRSSPSGGSLTPVQLPLPTLGAITPVGADPLLAAAAASSRERTAKKSKVLGGAVKTPRTPESRFESEQQGGQSPTGDMPVDGGTDWLALNDAVFRHSYQRSVVHLALSSVELDDDAWIWLCRITPLLFSLRILDLSNVAMTDERCRMLIGDTKASAGLGSPLYGISRSEKIELQTIDWCHNSLTSKSAPAIGKLLRAQCRTLKFVNLRANRLGDHGLQLIATQLRALLDLQFRSSQGVALRSLDLSRNRASTRGIVDLLTCSSMSQCVQHLSLYDNVCSVAGGKVRSPSSGAYPPSERSPSSARSPSAVSRSSWTPSIASHVLAATATPRLPRDVLHQMVCPNNLRTIDLSRCRLGSENACEMVRVILFTCTTLSELYLGGNGITDDIGAEFVDCERQLDFLTVLDLSDNPISSECATLLTHAVVALFKARNLQTLKLNKTEIAMDGVLNLVRLVIPDIDEAGQLVYCMLSSLVSLDLSYTNLSTVECDSLRESLKDSVGCTVRFGPPRDSTERRSVTQHTPTISHSPLDRSESPASPPTDAQETEVPRGVPPQPSPQPFRLYDEISGIQTTPADHSVAGLEPPEHAPAALVPEAKELPVDSLMIGGDTQQPTEEPSVAAVPKPSHALEEKEENEEKHEPEKGKEPAEGSASVNTSEVKRDELPVTVSTPNEGPLLGPVKEETVINSALISQECSPIKAESAPEGEQSVDADKGEEPPMAEAKVEPSSPDEVYEIHVQGPGESKNAEPDESKAAAAECTHEEKEQLIDAQGEPGDEVTPAEKESIPIPTLTIEPCTPAESATPSPKAETEDRPSPTSARDRLRMRREQRRHRARKLTDVWQHAPGHILCHVVHLPDKEALLAAVTADLDRILHNGPPDDDEQEKGPRTTVDVPDWDAGSLMTIHTQTTEPFGVLRERLRKASDTDFPSLIALKDTDGDSFNRLLRERYEAVGDSESLERIDYILHDAHGVEEDVVARLPPLPAEPEPPEPVEIEEEKPKEDSVETGEVGQRERQEESPTPIAVREAMEEFAPEPAIDSEAEHSATTGGLQVPDGEVHSDSSTGSGIVRGPSYLDEASAGPQIMIEPNDTVWSLPPAGVGFVEPKYAPSLHLTERVHGIDPAPLTETSCQVGQLIPAPPVSTLASAAAAIVKQESVTKRRTVTSAETSMVRERGGAAPVDSSQPGWLTKGSGAQELQITLDLDSERDHPAATQSQDVKVRSPSIILDRSVAGTKSTLTTAPTSPEPERHPETSQSQEGNEQNEVPGQTPPIATVDDVPVATVEPQPPIEIATVVTDDVASAPLGEVPVSQLLPFSETIAERKRTTHTPSSHSKRSPRGPDGGTGTPSTSPTAYPTGSPQGISWEQRSATRQRYQQMVKQSLTYAKKAVAKGVIDLPQTKRNKIRVCQGKMGRFDVTVSVEWDDYLVLKNKLGFGSKDLVLVHPLVAVEDSAEKPFITAGLGNNVLITVVKPRHLLEEQGQGGGDSTEPDESRTRRKHAFSIGDTQVLQIELGSQADVREAIRTLNQALSRTRARHRARTPPPQPTEHDTSRF